MNTFKRILFLVAVLGLAACEQANIVAPSNNAVSTEKPLTFQIAFTGSVAPSDLAIQLNTADVTSAFTVTDTGATADGSLLADQVFPGRNIFRVKGYNQIKQVAFYYDTEGPEIHIMDTDRDALTVTGYVSDPGGVESVMLDGVALELGAGNSFTASFTDQPFNTFVAVDGFGQSKTTEYARGDNEFVGISARLNQGGFDFLISVLEQELNGADFQDIVDGIGNIELINTFGLFNLNLRITDFYFDDVDIDLTVLDNERLDTDIYVNNFIFGINLNGTIGFLIPYSSGGTLQFDEVDLGTDLLLDIVDADLDINLSGTQINHTYPNIDFTNTSGILNIFDDITSAIVAILAPLFENLFIDILEQIIIPIVSDFIKGVYLPYV